MYFGREYSLVHDGNYWLIKSGNVILQQFTHGQRLQNLLKSLKQVASPEEIDRIINNYLKN